MMLIDSLQENIEPIGELEIVDLSWVERSRPRLRCFTNKGRELALALPRGTILADGDVLSNTEEATIIVRARPEPVLVIEAKTASEVCQVAHQLGNWHRALQFVSAECILTEPDGPLEDWLKRTNIAYQHETRPYHANMREIQHKIAVSL